MYSLTGINSILNLRQISDAQPDRIIYKHRSIDHHDTDTTNKSRSTMLRLSVFNRNCSNLMKAIRQPSCILNIDKIYEHLNLINKDTE